MHLYVHVCSFNLSLAFTRFVTQFNGLIVPKYMQKVSRLYTVAAGPIKVIEVIKYN